MKPDGSDLGTTLVQCAKVPVRQARAHLSAGRISEGLATVSNDNLLAALRDGIATTAKRIQIDPRAVERALPWDELTMILTRIVGTQRAAADVWERHSVAFGGMSTGFSGGTLIGDVRKQSAGEYLFNLAGRFVRDQHIHQPLKAFAADLLQWEEILDRCGEVIDQGQLAASYRHRRMLKRVGLLVAGLLVLGVASTVLGIRLTVSASQKRVDGALASADPCAVERIDQTDRKRARPDQLSQIESKRVECEKTRARARYVASCTAVADHLEAGSLTPEDEAFLGPKAAVMKRAATAALEVGDLMYPDDGMPCQDVPQIPDRLWKGFAKGAADSALAWAEASRVSEKIKALVTSKDIGLSETSRQVLSRRAEGISEKAIIAGRPADMERARVMCDFNLSLGVKYGRNCKGLLTAMGVRP